MGGTCSVDKKIKNAYKILDKNLQEKKILERPRCRW
jgi:hypothetical protein